MKKQKRKEPKNLVLRLLTNFYDLFEGYSFENSYFKYFIIYIYFFQTISYLYFFSLNDNKQKTALYFCYFHYYLNLTSFIHGLNCMTTFFLFFFICFSINILLLVYAIYKMILLKLRINRNKNFYSFQKIVNFLCDIYNRFILIPSIDIFLSNFQKSDKFFDEHPYFRSHLIENFDESLKVLGIIGLILSFSLSFLFLYLNQDYKFLDKTKFRSNFNIIIFTVFILKIIQSMVFRINSDLEWFHYFLTFFFLFISLSNYFTDFPFRNSQINKFYISVLLYSLMNVFLLLLYRMSLIKTEKDLFVNNLTMGVICYKLGHMVYEKYYMIHMFHETNDHKVSIFTLEEIMNLYMNAKAREKLNLILYGYFKFHYKHCANEKCQMKKQVFLKFHKLTPEDKQFFIVDFIYLNINDLISKRRTKKNSEGFKNDEIIYVKLLTLLIYYGVNPIKKFYEFQKILYENNNFSYYFTTLISALNGEIKKQIKLHLQNNRYDLTNTTIKNTYDQFFKASSVKSNLESKFKKLVKEKIGYFEKTKNGQQTVQDFFIANLKFSPKITKFKKKLKDLNSNSSFCNILKFKFLSLLYSIIFNNYSKAVVYERKLGEEFTSKTNELIDKSYMAQFFDQDTVICEASFLNSSGFILEKSKTSKFLSFFGYENNEANKIKYVNDLLPTFLREKHEKFVENFLNQRIAPDKAQLQSFALDKQGFSFPIYISFSLKHDYYRDFVLISAMRKAKSYEKRFCLLDSVGNILNISQDFFYDLKREYEFLELNDVFFINIFQLVPELNHYFLDNNGKNLTTTTSQTSKLYFPDKMKNFIELSKLKEREEKEYTMSRRKTFTKVSEETVFTNSKKRKNSIKPNDYQKTLIAKPNLMKNSSPNINLDSDDSFVQIMFNQENFKKAEIKYDLICGGVRYGKLADEKILYSVFIIKEYQRPNSIAKEDPFKRIEAPENIVNTTIFDQNRTNEPRVIHILANEEEKKGFGFKCKVREVKGPQFRKKNKDKNKDNLTESKSFFGSKEVTNGEVKTKNLTNQNSVTSSTDIKCENLIFSTIKKIKKTTPKPLRMISMILFLQIPILIIFALLYKIIGNYINNYFEPTQYSLFEFCQQYHYNTAMMLANIRFEYFSLGLIDPIELKEYQILKSIYTKSLKQINLISYDNRVSESELSFHKKLSMLYVDPLTLHFSNIQYIEFIDIILNQIQNYLPQMLTLNYRNINYDNLIFFQRNFPYFSLTSANINIQLQSELYTSNIPVFANMKNVMIIFLMIYLFIKLIEIYFWNDFMKTFKILQMIYSRTNETEIFQTIAILKDFQKMFVDTTDSYFNTSISDITKKENISNFDNQAKGKKGRNKLFTQLSNFPKLGLILYFMTSAALFGFYFSYNYYNWYNINNYIVKLITLDQVFVDNFFYSSSAVSLEDLLIREKIVDNPSYTKLNDTYQQKSARINYFKTNLDKRIVFIGNTSAKALIDNGLEILKEHETKNLTVIMKENLCMFLVDGNYMKPESEEFLLCQKLLNGAFQKGISNVVTGLVQKIKSREGNIQITETVNERIEQQKVMIKEYIASFDYLETFFSNFFLHMVLELYYAMNNQYFYELLDQQIYAFETFLFTTMVLMILIVLLFVKLIKIKVLAAFKFNCVVLSIIPSERLITDEQIFILLKKYLRDNE